MLSHQDTSEQILIVVGRQLGVHTNLTKHGMETKFIMLLYLKEKRLSQFIFDLRFNKCGPGRSIRQ